MDRIKMPTVATPVAPGSPRAGTAAPAAGPTAFGTALAQAVASRPAGNAPPMARGAPGAPGGGNPGGGLLGTLLPLARSTFHERALGLREYRQQLLASNIANADTPNYKAVDVDVTDAIRRGLGAGAPLEVNHVVPAQPGADGNTVDMDAERAKFAQNALLYEYEVDRVRGFYKNLEELLKNTPY